MATEGNGTGNGFTVKEIVMEIRRDVKELAEKVDQIDRQGSIGTRQELADHESRLREVERFSFRWSGAISFLVALGALGSAMFAVLHS